MLHGCHDLVAMLQIPDHSLSDSLSSASITKIGEQHTFGVDSRKMGHPVLLSPDFILQSPLFESSRYLCEDAPSAAKDDPLLHSFLPLPIFIILRVLVLAISLE